VPATRASGMRFLWPALGIALVAVWLRTLLEAMPPPFDDLVALPIPTGRQVLYPGKADGMKMKKVMKGVFGTMRGLRRRRDSSRARYSEASRSLSHPPACSS